MKALFVYGTRPEAIKIAPVIKKMQDAVIVNTGQHKELTKEVKNLFDFKDDYYLDIMTFDQTLHSITTKCLEHLSEIYKKEKPDVVVVHGDTTTAMSAALAAYYEKIPIAHVEAGLRTGDKNQPYPEEANRAIIDNLVDYAFCPTENNRINIGNKSAEIYVVGNTAIDSVLFANSQNKDTFSPCEEPYIFVTAHRRENHGVPLNNICQALKELSNEIKIIYAAHPNPNVQNAVESLRDVKNISVIKPLGYLDSVRYMANAKIILTDSGGIQEEAPSLNIPVLCLRNKTERQEAVSAGVVKLVGTQEDNIIREAKRLLNNAKFYDEMIKKENPYGDGTASDKISEVLNGEHKCKRLE